MSQPFVYAGVDVSQSSLTASLPGFGVKELENSLPKILKFLRKAKQSTPGLMVCCEASGGYEMELIEACFQEQVPVCVVAPNRVRHWARSRNILAKTDHIDAPLITDFATQTQPRLLQPPKPVWKRLRELTRERQFQVDRCKQLTNHAGRQKNPDIQKLHRSEIRAARKRIQQLQRLILQTVASDSDLQQLLQRLMDPKGIGLITALTVMAEFPCMGQLGPQAISALAGVAPFNNDSGKSKKRRLIRGGNARVRRVLYMAALTASNHNPILKNFYQRLLAKGKDAKQALTALSRKLIRLMERIAADPTFQPS